MPPRANVPIDRFANSREDYQQDIEVKRQEYIIRRGYDCGKRAAADFVRKDVERRSGLLKNNRDDRVDPRSIPPGSFQWEEDKMLDFLTKKKVYNYLRAIYPNCVARYVLFDEGTTHALQRELGIKRDKVILMVASAQDDVQELVSQWQEEIEAI